MSASRARPRRELDRPVLFRRSGSRWTRSLVALGEHGFLMTLTLASAFPLAVMMLASLKDRASFSSGTLLQLTGLSFDNYVTVWRQLGFGGLFRNSVILSLASAALVCILAACAAFGLTRRTAPLRRSLLTSFIVLMGTPAIVVLVPVYVALSRLGMLNTYVGGIALEVALLTPFATVLIASFMRDLPAELFEAADVDGASALRQFALIAVPMSRTALVTAFLVCGIFAWNDLLVPLLVWQSERLQTLMVGLAVLGPARTGARDVPLLMAGVAVSVLPLMALFAVARRNVVQGLTEGSDR